MTRHAIICTRSKNLRPITEQLTQYLYSADINVNMVYDKDSIFNGYIDGINEVNPNFNDDIILCHDDIKILSDSKHFNRCLNVLNKDKCGFIGVAGTKYLNTNCVWWQPGINYNPLLGCVWHGEDSLTAQYTAFGQYDKAVVMDGVFLAAKYSTLKLISLTKPDKFKGNWDFYDIYYTIQATLKGLHNYVLPIHIMHNSPGEGILKDSWKDNRVAFSEMYEKYLPCEV